MNKLLVCFCGPSGSGKTTLSKASLEQIQKTISGNNHFLVAKKLISNTTRDMRENEKDGVDYYFQKKNLYEGDFVETTTYNNNSYGLSKKEFNSKYHIGFYICDAVGRKKILNEISIHNSKYYNQDNKINLLTFYIKCSSSNSIERMNERKDSQEKIIERLKNALEINEYDFKSFLTADELSNQSIDGFNIVDNGENSSFGYNVDYISYAILAEYFKKGKL